MPILSLVTVAQTTHAVLGGCGGTVPERVLSATPSDYLSILPTLQPGDLLELGPGTYPDGLNLQGINGEPDRCVIIAGPSMGPPAVFTGRSCCNTVSLGNSSYLVIRNLTIDGGGELGDAVKAESTADWCHHITLENLTIINQDADQQIVAINTKCPTWNWVIRKNHINGAGTGLYLGDSNGEDEFANGLIEFNVITNTIGYNMQIKHQNGRAVGSPANGQTIIRHNVFNKTDSSSTGGNARPNLLVGHWPDSGPGANDIYLIYGNLFFGNPSENLFQGEGHIAFYQNLLVSSTGGAVAIQPHNGVPKTIHLFQNTIVSAGTGIFVTGGDPGFSQLMVGNAVFSDNPLVGGTQMDNVTDDYDQAGTYLNNPFGDPVVGTLDLFPMAGVNSLPMDLSAMVGYEDWDLDFNASPRPGTYRGAYAGDGVNPGWNPQIDTKCLLGSGIPDWELWPIQSILQLLLQIGGQCLTPP
ncbi:MAG: hypothetical protein KDC35_16645 [Acidobacteria bacterium]|nr:hypothetical protein [Acidobacteriota bacterium]